MNNASRARRRMRIIMWVMAVAVLVPSLYGFGTKFLEFIALYRGDAEGAFAISPVLNYLLASLGFLCLFGWAALRGMFRDVERPKFTLLENEDAARREHALASESWARSTRESSSASRSRTTVRLTTVSEVSMNTTDKSRRQRVGGRSRTSVDARPPIRRRPTSSIGFIITRAIAFPGTCGLSGCCFGSSPIYYALQYLFPEMRIELKSPP